LVKIYKETNTSKSDTHLAVTHRDFWHEVALVQLRNAICNQLIFLSFTNCF
jgi:hypothetical protein